MIQSLQWDSDFLKYKTGKAEPASATDIDPLYQAAKDEQYKLVYIFINNEDLTTTRSCLAKDWLLADKKQTYTQKISGKLSVITDNIRSIEVMSDELLALALQSGIYSRFKVDPGFKPNTYEELYRIWIERSVKREIAEQVWGYYHHNELAGMLTFGKKNNRADIGLLAVDGRFRGLGIGSALVKKAIQHCRDLGIEEIQVVTQGDNTPAIHLYQKEGFVLEEQINIFHLWL